ncbi:MAG: clostripain-related cysteine peptidase [Elusimicrobiales bacterium]
MSGNIVMAVVVSVVFQACAAFAAVNYDNPAPGAKGVRNAANSAAVTGTAVPSAPAAGPADAPQSAKPAALPKWTVMVFMNGKNELEQFAFTNFYQMERVGSDNDIQVVVEFGRMGNVANDGKWTGCRRYLVKKANDTDKISSPVVETIPQCDMGDYKHAADFGKWAMSKYPAQHYMYILWNHGGGWTKAMDNQPAKIISADDETGNHINTPQMGALLKSLGRKMDVYASDACLMQMAEVTYELKDYASYVVGSEELEAGDGYTYDAFLQKAHGSDMEAASLSKAAVDSYADHYTYMATQSYVDSKTMPELVKKMDAFADAVMTSGNKEAVKKALTATQHYAVNHNYRDNADLYHFVSLVATPAETNPKIKEAAGALMDYLKGSVIKHNRVTFDYADSHGLAVYLPAEKYDTNYDELAFAKAGKWPKFAQWLVAN